MEKKLELIVAVSLAVLISISIGTGCSSSLYPTPQDKPEALLPLKTPILPSASPGTTLTATLASTTAITFDPESRSTITRKAPASAFLKTVISPSPIPSETPQPTVHFLALTKSQSLQDLALKPEDISKSDPNYPLLFAQFQQKSWNMTYEMENNCALDCAKIIWGRQPSNEFNGITLILIRMKTSDEAMIALNSVWQELSPQLPGERTYDDGCIKAFELPETCGSRVWVSGHDVKAIVAAVQGPLFLLIIHQYSSAVDLNVFTGDVQQLAMLQFEKLKAAGYASR